MLCSVQLSILPYLRLTLLSDSNKIGTLLTCWHKWFMGLNQIIWCERSEEGGIITLNFRPAKWTKCENSLKSPLDQPFVSNKVHLQVSSTHLEAPSYPMSTCLPTIPLSCRHIMRVQTSPVDWWLTMTMASSSEMGFTSSPHSVTKKAHRPEHLTLEPLTVTGNRFETKSFSSVPHIWGCTEGQSTAELVGT